MARKREEPLLSVAAPSDGRGSIRRSRLDHNAKNRSLTVAALKQRAAASFGRGSDCGSAEYPGAETIPTVGVSAPRTFRRRGFTRRGTPEPPPRKRYIRRAHV